MIWSLNDFAREIRRQIVEVEALRRKTRNQPDAKEHLARLQESQRQLLRKLHEYFESRRRDSEGKECETGGAHGGEPAGQQAIPEDLLACIQSILRHPALLEQLGQHLGCGGEKVHAWLVIGVNAGEATPDKDESRSRRRCQEEPEDDFWQPYSLN
jgi:hypothetical protein